MTNRDKESLVLAKLAAQILDEKKGEDVRVLDLRKVHGAPAEFFVIASGNVPSHVSAMSDAVFEVLITILLLHDDNVHDLLLHLIHHSGTNKASIISLLFLNFMYVILCHF